LTEAEYENSYLKIREANKQLSSELSKAVKQCERQTQEIQRMINLADTGLELESKVKKYLSQESIELEFLKAF
jgi:membrane protease subunit (stomatin/prohibitin family)